VQVGSFHLLVFTGSLVLLGPLFLVLRFFLFTPTFTVSFLLHCFSSHFLISLHYILYTYTPFGPLFHTFAYISFFSHTFDTLHLFLYLFRLSRLFRSSGSLLTTQTHLPTWFHTHLLVFTPFLPLHMPQLCLCLDGSLRCVSFCSDHVFSARFLTGRRLVLWFSLRHLRTCTPPYHALHIFTIVVTTTLPRHARTGLPHTPFHYFRHDCRRCRSL